LTLTVILSLSRTYISNYQFALTQWNTLSVLLLSLLNLTTLTTLIILYNIFGVCIHYKCLFSSTSKNMTIFYHTISSNFISNLPLDAQYFSVYYFPFIYIFILVTFLSLFFCLTYNKSEFNSFTFFCFLILLSGYVLFYTDSLILFFMSYEMLLIPSFFILYKFAKTRRSVEAAYLMFFWTQFGAMFLIFGL
jgi:formate hydrogenlyase subunit 3/multisubunit Na+/H+ antiporter MnhD subunit